MMQDTILNDRRRQVRKIVDEHIRRAGFEVFRGRNTGADGNRANAIFTRRNHILRGIAHQRNRRVLTY